MAESPPAEAKPGDSSMTPERWQQIQDVFGTARTYRSRDRAAFLDQACAGDNELRSDVDWMLDHQNEAEQFLREPALAVAEISLAGNRTRSLTGSALGPYQNLELIGVGGMGEVYKARDSKLGRDVAIKVLPQAFANDSGRLARFQREAQVLASLNHPNISTIHDIQED